MRGPYSMTLSPKVKWTFSINLKDKKQWDLLRSVCRHDLEKDK